MPPVHAKNSTYLVVSCARGGEFNEVWIGMPSSIAGTNQHRKLWGGLSS
jgi:hypothetical protein